MSKSFFTAFRRTRRRFYFFPVVALFCWSLKTSFREKYSIYTALIYRICILYASNLMKMKSRIVKPHSAEPP